VRRIASIGVVAVALGAFGCGGDDGPFDMGWGLTCSSDRFGAIALDYGETAGFATPEIAVDRFLNPDVPEGVYRGHLPGASLPKDGWERADFVPTQAGTEPITGTLPHQFGSAATPQMAFVHHDGERVDGVLMMRAQPGGWVVADVHTCAG
jgi:hypothetical protein